MHFGRETYVETIANSPSLRYVYKKDLLFLTLGTAFLAASSGHKQAGIPSSQRIPTINHLSPKRTQFAGLR
jgi:hypothetical protein